MNILKEIVAYKKKEVQNNRSLFPVKLLEQSIYFEGQPVSLKKYIRHPDKSGIIAEIKRKSPSKGILNAHISIEYTSIGYMQAGASGLSILTDNHYFGGSLEDLKIARMFNFCPILRKEFIIDEYQILESKSIGADVILLIAAILTKKEIENLAKMAHQLEMEVILEVHNEEEVKQSITPHVDMIGVNNRNLETFHTDIQTSLNLASKIPNDFIKISESGIEHHETIKKLQTYGYEGFLIGETFMKHSRPEKVAKAFIQQLT